MQSVGSRATECVAVPILHSRDNVDLHEALARVGVRGDQTPTYDDTETLRCYRRHTDRSVAIHALRWACTLSSSRGLPNRSFGTVMSNTHERIFQSKKLH